MWPERTAAISASKSTTPARLSRMKAAPWRMLANACGAEKTLVLAGDRGDDEDEIALAEHRRRGSAGSTPFSRRIDGGSQGSKTRIVARKPESTRLSALPRSPKPMMPISEPDSSRADAVALAAPQFAALAEVEIGIDDAARQVERQRQPHLGDRLGKDRAGRHDMDAALEQPLIGHVVDEVALDIEHAAQRLHRRRASRR